MKISNELLTAIQNLPTPKIIAVSGLGGSGKTFFAEELGKTIGAPIVGVDSFQRDGAFDTKYSLWNIMDYSRLEKEVFLPFHKGEKILRYGHFNVPTKSIAETREITNNGTLIVEGVGLFRPELTNYFSYKIWIDCPIETAVCRGKKRDKEEHNNPTDECWDGIWKENDLQYLKTFKPKESADVVVDNS